MSINLDNPRLEVMPSQPKPAPEMSRDQKTEELRNYFAGKAMQALIREYVIGNGPCIGLDHPYRNIPVLAYRMADAMVEEAQK